MLPSAADVRADARRGVRAVLIGEVVLLVGLALAYVISIPALNDDWYLFLFQAGHVLSLFFAIGTLRTRGGGWPAFHFFWALLMLAADAASVVWRAVDDRLCGRALCPSRWLAVVFALMAVVGLIGIDMLYMQALLRLRAVLIATRRRTGTGRPAVTYEKLTLAERRAVDGERKKFDFA